MPAKPRHGRPSSGFARPRELPRVAFVTTAIFIGLILGLMFLNFLVFFALDGLFNRRRRA